MEFHLCLNEAYENLLKNVRTRQYEGFPKALLLMPTRRAASYKLAYSWVITRTRMVLGSGVSEV